MRNMNEQMRKLREEIEQTQNEEKTRMGETASAVHRENILGWIEALEYVLGQIDALEGEEE